MRKLLFGFVLCGVLAMGILGMAKNSMADWEDITGAITNGDVVNTLSLHTSYVNVLTQASSGAIYAGGYYYDVVTGPDIYRYVWKYENGIWTDITGNLLYYSVTSLVEMSDGSILAADSSYDNIWRYFGGTWTNIGGDVDTAGSAVVFLFRTGDGSIYAGTQDAIWKYNSGTSWTNISSTFGSISVRNMIEGVDGSIYVLGYVNNYGVVWKYSGGSWIDLSRGLVAIGVSAIVQTSDGALYVGGYFNPQARVWKYDGSWSEVTGSMNMTSMGDLVKVNDNLLVAAGALENYAAVWTYASGSWTDRTGSLDGTAINDLLVGSDSTVFAGGWKTKSGTGFTDRRFARVWAYNDTTAPVTSISPAAGTYKTSQTVALSSVDDMSGVAAIYYSTDGKKPKQKNKYKYTTSFSVDSNLTVKYFAIDNKGNKEKIKTAKYKIGEAVWIMDLVKKRKLQANGSEFQFTTLKKKLKKSKYYFKVKQFNKYGLGVNEKKAIKRYWRMKTNLDAKKGYKVKMIFKYTKKLVKGLSEGGLKLMDKTPGKGWVDAGAKLNTKKDTLTLSWKKFGSKKTYFTIANR